MTSVPAPKPKRETKLARRIREASAAVMPLSEFSEDMRLRVEWQIEQPRPPSRWLSLCDGLAYIESRGWHEWHWARGQMPGEGRSAIPTDVRKAVMQRDGYVCGICGGDVERDDVHLDHIKPYSKGGDHTVDNLRVTHSLCNIRRGARED